MECARFLQEIYCLSGFSHLQAHRYSLLSSVMISIPLKKLTGAYFEMSCINARMLDHDPTTALHRNVAETDPTMPPQAVVPNSTARRAVAANAHHCQFFVRVHHTRPGV